MPPEAPTLPDVALEAPPAPDWRVGPDDWPAALAAAAGPQLVVAGPGTGKTEFLVGRALHLIGSGAAAPSQVLLLTFSRRAADELRRRVEGGLRLSHTGIAASTFHSFALRLLETHAAAGLGWSEMPSLLTGPEQVALIAELLAAEDPANWPLSLRGLLGTRTFAEEVTDFLLRAREHLLDPAELARRARARDDWRAMPGFSARYEEALRRRRRIDYGTLQAEAVRLLETDPVRAQVGEQYRYVLVDEYQDTTAAQAHLLELLVDSHQNLTAAADPYQSVYSFRGAELQNVAEFTVRFRDADGAPARRLVLTTSFRVPAEILTAAERITAGGDLPGAAGGVVPAPHPGRVEAYLFAQQSAEAAWVAAEVDRLNQQEGFAFDSMAVLVRSKRRFLPELSRALDRRGIPHDPPDGRLVDHPAVRVLFDLALAASATGSTAPGAAEEADRAVRRLLLGELFAVPLGVERDLLRERRRSARPWPEVLVGELTGVTELAGLLADPRWLDLPAAEGFWHVWTSLPQFATAVADAEQGENRAAWAAFAQALDRQGERDPRLTLRGYLELADQDEFEAVPLLSYRRSDLDHLTLTTLHQAKGLEFEVVFLTDAVEGVFPDLRRSRSLLRPYLLSPHRSDDAAAMHRFRLQEEMRLAYTAMTRARRRVVWTATRAGIDEGERRPSRFLLAAAGVDGTDELGAPAEGPPVTHLEVEAWLRRTLVDPVEPAPRRLAAAGVLAARPNPSARPAGDFAFTRPRGPDRGLLPETLRLSPSQADAYEECPRKYALERRLRVEEQTSVYAAFGTMIHLVLELTEAEALAKGERHGTLETAQQRLDEIWPRFEAEFGAPPFAAAWRRRAAGLLERLYTGWIRGGRVVATERLVASDLGGVAWTGRIDRVEETSPGKLRIVDYKTTKSNLPTIEEAKVAMQLGFYLYAASSDPELAAMGRAEAAEFWYPLYESGKNYREFDPDRLDEVIERMEAVAAKILDEHWQPKLGEACGRCRVKVVCPLWPEGREAFAR